MPHPSSPASHSPKRCSCGRPSCQAPQVYLNLQKASDRKAVLRHEVRYLEKHLRFLEQVKADREKRLACWQQQQGDYQAKMQQAWLVSSRPASPKLVDLSAFARTESEWYRRQLQELTLLFQEKQEDLEAAEEYEYSLRLALAKLDKRPGCSHRIAKVLHQHRNALLQRKQFSQERCKPLFDQRRSLNESYDATCQRVRQHQAIPPTLLEAKQAINLRWMGFVLLGIGKPESRKEAHTRLNQEVLAHQYQQECELHRAFFWYTENYFQLGKALIIEGLPDVLDERIKDTQYIAGLFSPASP